MAGASLGGHCIDLLEMFFGPVRKVLCLTGNLVHDYKSEDSATVLLQFDNGVQGLVDAFFCIPDASLKNRLELYGSGGSILAEGTIGQGPGGTPTSNRQRRNTTHSRPGATRRVKSPLPPIS